MSGASLIAAPDRHPGPELERLRTALFDWSLEGLRKTGEVYPLGAFLLTGAMIDVLGGLYFNPREEDRRQGVRYAAFVERFFPPDYQRLGLGKKLWRGLRCLPLHNFSAKDVLLLHGQGHLDAHLHEYGDSVVLRWEDFLADYQTALAAYWSALLEDETVENAALGRCARYPPFTINEIPIPTAPVVTLPAEFAAATAYAGPKTLPGGGQPSEGMAVASGGVGDEGESVPPWVDPETGEQKRSGGDGGIGKDP